MPENFSTPSAGGLPFAAAVPKLEALKPEAQKPEIQEELVTDLVDGDSLEEKTKREAAAVKTSYTPAELDAFWDAVLANKPYMEKRYFGKKGKQIEVVFKTRGSDDVNEIHDELDSLNIRYRPKFNLRYAQFLLATALHAYNGKLLPTAGTDEKTLLELRLEFIRQLSEPVAVSLNKMLLEFETKIGQMQEAVFSDSF